MSICTNCELEPAYGAFDDCLKCQAAYIIACPEPWESNRKYYEGSDYLVELDAEIARQRAALDVTPIRMTIRQAS